MGDEEFIAAYIEKNRAVVEELKKNEGVKDAWYGKVIYCLITAAVPNPYTESRIQNKYRIQLPRQFYNLYHNFFR